MKPDSSSTEDQHAFAAAVAEAVLREPGRDGLLAALLPALADALDLRSAGMVSQRRGHWSTDHWYVKPASDSPAGAADRGVPLPENKIADAVDRGRPQTSLPWWLVPCQVDLGNAAGSGIVASPLVGCLVLRLPEGSAGPAARDQQMCDLLIAALSRAEILSRQRHRIDQLSSVLEAAARWQRTQLQASSDDETLLRRIADTATELLDCERASIFLWDRRRSKLIGRPALGIDDRPLEVPDDAGVVGEVLSTSEPQIWNGDSDDESRVNRDVDRSLAFDTRSLVAVPLVGQRGETIGVFEAINHRANQFDESHVLLLSDLSNHAAVAIEAQRAKKSLTESRDRLVRDAARSTPLIGEHPDIVAVRENATRVAGTDLTVLVLGSNGTGKEVLARHIHYQSERRNGPFIAVNCAALVESLLESELFGHEKGSFTDANTTRIGKFELASGGTLFLDEVGDMSAGGQAKLLRVLEQKEVVRVGGSLPISVDVRVIAATNQPLDRLIDERRFREDLFFRLNVVSLSLPDLAQRGRDVLLLADHFLQHFCYQIGRRVPVLNHSAQTALLSHPWPGNVRELRNTIERVCYLSTGNELSARDLELRPAGGASKSRVEPLSSRPDTPESLSESTRLFQIEHIKQAIDKSGGNMTEAAARLDLHRSNLYRKMKQLGMQVGDDL
ncbi:sigma-54-dependent Fis family transcriptional regulator [Roseiconus nitratireducens]|uniref:Sigma-54-dependent Fis family transcriptional regulator n=1 Tax=Roseiconus nitratireducens TaxID=2605748 RepID=A0A5M6D3Z6_9BACT|nr:sigma-54-dependent Fis family transcriptional regulator [Roseiconus nitratireducens]KAA5542214.1 sigma-54-dependent Fis family transcriptional regulator [Roseiconus nitratireducens]